jgi:dihydroneopterin aldolase
MSVPFTGDRIILKGLGFFGYHGVLSAEQTLGQRFFIDLECGTDLSAAASTDSIAGAISYADLYEVVRQTFDSQRVDLIEALAHRIVTALFAQFAGIDWIVIRVRKPEAPIAMVRGEAAIELHRTRPQ